MREKSKRILKSEITWEILFLAFLFCFYVGWAYLIPYDACPDEDQRNRVAKFIYENWRLPHGADPAIRNEIWGFSYAFNPILPYMIGAVFMKITSLVTTDAAWLVLASRMVSVLSGVGAGWFVIRIGKRLFDGTKRVFFIGLVTLLPGAVFVYSYVNCDAMAMFSISIIVYAWVKGMDTEWDGKYCSLLAVGISVCALSYYNAYGFILCSILFFCFSILFCFRKQWDYKTLLKKGIFVSCIVLLLISWWFIRNAILYDGDLLGMRTSSYYGELYAQDGMKPSQRVSAQAAGLSLWEMLTEGYNTEISWLKQVVVSFIGCFGHMDLNMPTAITIGFLAVMCVGVLGAVLHFRTDFTVRKEKEWRITGVFNWCMLIAMVIPVILNIIYSYTSDYQPQGRYSLPMLIPLAYFVTKGIDNWLNVFIKNEKVKEIVYVVLGAAILIAVLYVYKTVIRFTYLPDPLIQF